MSETGKIISSLHQTCNWLYSHWLIFNHVFLSEGDTLLSSCLCLNSQILYFKWESLNTAVLLNYHMDISISLENIGLLRLFSSAELFWLKSVLHPYVVSISHFQLLQNHCMLSHQTYHKCSTSVVSILSD
jgi:hypothetical protein